MHHFSNPWKHQKIVNQKIVRFSDVFRWYRKDALGTNGLTSLKAPEVALKFFHLGQKAKNQNKKPPKNRGIFYFSLDLFPV